MARRRDDQTNEERIRPEQDDVERLIRWSLEDSVSGAEPSAKVWASIAARVRNAEPGSGRDRASGRRWLQPLVPLAQAVVVSAILLVFGLGVDQERASTRGYRLRATPTVTTSTVIGESSDDVLRGYMLFRREPERPMQRPLHTIEMSLPE